MTALAITVADDATHTNHFLDTASNYDQYLVHAGTYPLTPTMLEGSPWVTLTLDPCGRGNLHGRRVRVGRRMKSLLERTSLDIAALLLAAADLGVTAAGVEMECGAVTPDPDPLNTGWPGLPSVGSLFTTLMGRPGAGEADTALAGLLSSWWEAGYAARFDTDTFVSSRDR